MPVTTANLLRAIRRTIWSDASMTGFAQDIVLGFKSTAALIDEANAAIAAAGTGGGAVSSVFARTGAVVAVLNDYAASLVDNDSGVAGATAKDALDALATLITALTSTVTARSTIGVYSARAALTPAAGDRFTCTNSPQGEWIYSGSAWVPLLLCGVPGVQPPAASNFTKLGASSASITDNNGTLRLNSAAGSAVVEGWTYSVTPSSTFTCRVGMMVGPWDRGSLPIGIRLGKTSSGEYITCTIYNNSATFLTQVQYFTSLSVGSTVLQNANAFDRLNAGNVMWFRIDRDATNIFFYVSFDNTNWLLLYQEAKAAHFAADNVGIYSNTTSGAAYGADIHSFSLV